MRSLLRQRGSFKCVLPGGFLRSNRTEPDRLLEIFSVAQVESVELTSGIHR